MAVVRGPGIYGVVTVPFSITSANGQLSEDVQPNTGVVTFNDRQVLLLLFFFLIKTIKVNKDKIKINNETR